LVRMVEKWSDRLRWWRDVLRSQPNGYLNDGPAPNATTTDYTNSLRRSCEPARLAVTREPSLNSICRRRSILLQVTILSRFTITDRCTRRKCFGSSRRSNSVRVMLTKYDVLPT